MMKRVFSIVLAMGLFWFASIANAAAARATLAQISYDGVFDCFDASLSQPQAGKKPTYCETSAVVAANGQIYTASDKEIPGASPVMALTLEGDRLTRTAYINAPTILQLQKAEDFDVAPEGDRVFLASGFDRVRPDGKWDTYNMLLTWKVGEEAQAQVIEPTGQPATSVSIRPRLQKALPIAAFPDGAPYFKVEGFASLPDHRLLFGIREIGQDYANFDYTMQLVATRWDESDPLHLQPFERIYKYNPQEHPQIDRPVGLSSITWDPVREQLLLLTSYELEETDKGLGAYLWTLSLEDLEKQNPPTLVMKTNGKPLLFAHKAEAVTVLPDGRLLVIHDDDRVLGDRQIGNPEEEFYREPYQAAYTLVQLLEPFSLDKLDKCVDILLALKDEDSGLRQG